MNEILIAFIIYIIKALLFVFAIALPFVPLSVWIERRLIARIQQRLGPNRVGLFNNPYSQHWFQRILRLWGLGQGSIADGLKLLLKEDCKPKTIYWFLHTIAPAMTVVPAFIVICILPMGPSIEAVIGGVDINNIRGNDLGAMGVTDLDTIGILFYLAMTGLGLYGIVMAGWASNSKYSLLGGIRSSAQMLSYELAMGLAVVGTLLIANTISMRELVAQQEGGFWNWYAFKQPVGFMLFVIAGFAETNRLPFDLAEGESELGGGFHTEYGSMKFASFFMAEYMNMFAFSAITVTLFLGGFYAPVQIPALSEALAGMGMLTVGPVSIGIGSVIGALICHAWFILKVLAILCFFVIVRGTLPRLRYDQLMNFGWKILFPLGLINMVITAGIMVFAGQAPAEGGSPVTPFFAIVLLLAGVIQLVGFDMLMNRRKRRLLGYVS